jgi:hypothetical protein
MGWMEYGVGRAVNEEALKSVGFKYPVFFQ